MINSKLISLLPARARLAVMCFVTLIYLSECRLLSISYEKSSSPSRVDSSLLHLLLSPSPSDVSQLHQVSELFGALSKGSSLNIERADVQPSRTITDVTEILPDVCKLTQDASDFWFRC